MSHIRQHTRKSKTGKVALVVAHEDSRSAEEQKEKDAKRKHSHFSRGSGSYKCMVCGKQTRETGEGESDVNLCAKCYIEGGLENEHSDGKHPNGYDANCPTCKREGKVPKHVVGEKYVDQFSVKKEMKNIEKEKNVPTPKPLKQLRTQFRIKAVWSKNENNKDLSAPLPAKYLNRVLKYFKKELTKRPKGSLANEKYNQSELIAKKENGKYTVFLREHYGVSGIDEHKLITLGDTEPETDKKKIKIIDVDDISKSKMQDKQSRLEKRKYKVLREDEDGILMGKKKRNGMKRILITTNGTLKKMPTETLGEKETKEKKQKKKSTSKNPWIQKYGKFGLTRYPVPETKESEVKVDLSGDIHSKAVMSWRDKKTGKLIHSYTREFMKRNAQKKWNRLTTFSKEKMEMIKKNAIDKIDSKDKTVSQSAAIALIIAETGLRVGSESVFAETGNMGVSTLGPDNITINGDSISFNFQGKSYQENNASLENAKLAKYLSALKKQKKGKDRLFDVTYSDIKHVFKYDIAKTGKLKIKDMRTFVASSLAVDILNSLPKIKWQESKTKNKKLLKEHLKKTFKAVAEKLNNTESVAKGSYIHPIILSEYLEKIKAPDYLLPEKGGK